MNEPENPLSRWARLKQAAKAEEKAETAPAGSEAAAVGEELFDPASLPSIESIVGDTDIVAFLRTGVPAELTRAALRKAWTSDPAIRDFIGIAENQWDFNDPNAIPGFGPLLPTEPSVDVLAQISSRLPRSPDEGLQALEQTFASNGNALAAEPPSVSADPFPASLDAAPNEARVGDKGEGTSTSDEIPKTRRHGSALPR